MRKHHQDNGNCKSNKKSFGKKNIFQKEGIYPANLMKQSIKKKLR
jgi:hypothetical protein